MPRKTLTTTCTLDCPDACALEVSITNGSISTIRGARRGHPNTNGFICSKVARFDRRVYHPDRLKHPLRRTGAKGEGRFTQISWDEAISEICTRFTDISNTLGSEAILPYHYGGSNGLLGDEFLDHYFFARLGASRCAKTLCAAPTTAVATGMYGKMPGVAYEDYPRAAFILIWGANPKVSNIHLMPYLKKARRHGAFIAVVDPKRNFTHAEIDMHLPVYPGTDLPLALGLIHHWHESGALDMPFLEKHAGGWQPLLAAAAEWPVERVADVSGIPAADIMELADRYASTSPALLRCGWGVERNRNGGQAVAAILAMPALLGKFAIPGGGYTLSNSGAVKFDAAALLNMPAWNSRVINQSQLGQLLNGDLDPPIAALFVYNCNPLATAPEQNRVREGLLREDLFTVAFDQVMTDTADYADIVLPAVTFLEQLEIKKGYGSYVICGVRPVIPPVGESKPNEEVFAMLGRGMGWTDDVFRRSTDQWITAVSAALVAGKEPVDAAVMRKGETVAVTFDESSPVQFGNVFPRTADQKIHLTPACLGAKPYVYLPPDDDSYPLALISPANNRMISSTMGEFNYPQLFATIHPLDAAQRGITDGDALRVHNAIGEVHCHAEVSAAVRPGVVSMPKGAWMKSSINGQTANALCPPEVNAVAGGACFNDARVEVELLGSSAISRA